MKARAMKSFILRRVNLCPVMLLLATLCMSENNPKLIKKSKIDCIEIGAPGNSVSGSKIKLGTSCSRQNGEKRYMLNELEKLVCSVCCAGSYFEHREIRCLKCGEKYTNNDPGTLGSCSDKRPITPKLHEDSVDLTPPSNLTISSGKYFQYLRWIAPPGEIVEGAEYLIMKRSSKIGGWEKVSTDPEHLYLNQTEVNITGLRPFTFYQYFILVKLDKAHSEQNVKTSFTRTLRGPPSMAPDNITIKLRGSGDYEVTFEEIHPMYRGTDTIVWYMLRLEQEMSGDIRLFFIKSGNLQIIPKLEGGVESSVSVQAKSYYGEGPWSRPVTFVTAVLVPQDSPKNVRFKAIQAEKAEIVWSVDSINEDINYDYVIEVSWGRNGRRIYNTTQLGTSLDDLDYGTKYSVRVAAYTVFGIGPWSPMKTFTTKLKPPQNAPRNVNVKIHGNEVRAKWEPIKEMGKDEERLSGYKVEYWKEGYIIKRKTTNKTCLRFVVDKNSNYYVRVRGYSDGGYGRSSRPFFVKSTGSLSDNESTLTCATTRVEVFKISLFLIFGVKNFFIP